MKGNLFDELPQGLTEEEFRTLADSPGCRIERIVSRGQASPPGFWDEPACAEWVVVLQGAATLRFEDEGQARHLGPGDWVNIAAGRRHRVEWTVPDRETVWLAVHYEAAKTRSAPSDQ